MDSDIRTAKEQENSENDEVDGSVVSRFRRRRGVKVTGRHNPSLECETANAFHSVSSFNNSCFKNINDNTENNFQTSDMSTTLHLKDRRQDSTQTGRRNDNTTKTKQRSQIMQPVVFTQACDIKKGKDIPQAKIKDEKVSDKNASDDDDLVPCGSAISKETLEELKYILKESPSINCKNKWIPKTSNIIYFPHSVDSRREKPDLTFQTFRPNLEIKPEKTFEKEKSFEMLIDPILQEPALAENEEQSKEHIQQSKENHVHEQLGIASGIKSEFPATEFKDAVLCSSKQGDASNDRVQNPLHLIAHIEHIKQQMAKEDVRFVRFEAADLHGVSRSKTIPARFFQDKAVNGLSIPRSYLELSLESRDDEIDHFSSRQFNCNILLKPDLQTFRVLPWTDRTARVICDSFTFMGNPLLTSPRYLAKCMLHELEKSGFLLRAAFTYEFCIFGVAEIMNSKTVSFPAATLLSDHQIFLQKLFDAMYYMGGNIESFSSSSASGQIEVSFQPEYGLAVADNAFTFKTGIKEAAKKQGYIASFYSDSVGFFNSGVFLHSLWDLSGTNNLFHSRSHLNTITDIGRKWLSGLMLHSAALSCLTAPGVACRKQFFKDDKEPKESTYVTFGSNDNSCSYNIKSHGCNGTYVENKLCSATANPYLVLAATIAAGLDGIRKDLDLLDSLSSAKFPDAPQIPLKLEDALSALKQDKYMRASLKEPFIQYFLAMKRYELETEEGDAERNTILEYFI